METETGEVPQTTNPALDQTKCPICGKLLLRFSAVKRISHLKRCEAEEKKKKNEKQNYWKDWNDCAKCGSILSPNEDISCHMKSCSSGDKDSEKHTKDFRCPLCDKNLNGVGEIQIQRHVNRCAEEAEKQLALQKMKEQWHGAIDCPVCGRGLVEGADRIVHIKKCAKEAKLSPADILPLLRKQEELAVSKRKRGLQHTSLSEPSAVSVPKKRKDKMMPNSLIEEQLQIAKALSLSVCPIGKSDGLDRVTECSFKKGEHAKKSVLLDPVDASTYLQERLSRNSAVESRMPDDLTSAVSKFSLKATAVKTHDSDLRFWSYEKPLIDENERLGRTVEMATPSHTWAPENGNLVVMDKRLAIDYQRLLESGFCCDLAFEVANGKPVMAHSLIIFARCPSLFELVSGKKTCDGLKNFDRPVVENFIRFLYSGVLATIDQTHLDHIKILAKRFGLFELEKLCQHGETQEASQTWQFFFSQVNEHEKKNPPPSEDPASENTVADQGDCPAEMSAGEENLCFSTELKKNYTPEMALEETEEKDFSREPTPDLFGETYNCCLSQNFSLDRTFGKQQRESDDSQLSRDTEALLSMNQDFTSSGISDKVKTTPGSLPTDYRLSGVIDVEDSVSFSAPSSPFTTAATENSIGFENAEKIPTILLSPSPTDVNEQFTPVTLDKNEMSSVPQEGVADSFPVSSNIEKIMTPAACSHQMVASGVGLCGESLPPGCKLLKVNNITPMPNYPDMDTPTVKNELKKFGLRQNLARNKKKTAALLEKIYESTHPVVMLKPRTNVPPIQGLHEDEGNSSSDDDDDEKDEILEESVMGFESSESSQEEANQENLRQFIRRDLPAMYRKILLFEPIAFEEMEERVKNAKFKCSQKQLIDFLDRENVCWYFKNKSVGRRKPKGKK